MDIRPRSSSSDDDDDDGGHGGGGNGGEEGRDGETKMTERTRRRKYAAVVSIAALLVLAGIVVLTLHLTVGLGGGGGDDDDGGEASVSRENVALGVIERYLPPETRNAVIDASASSPQRDALAWMLYDDAYDAYDWVGLARDPPDVDAEFVFVQRFVLSTFYIALDGDDWVERTNWMTGEDVCDWHGIECFGSSTSSSSAEGGRRALQTNATRGDAIRSLALPENILMGSLPADIVALAHLENLEVFRNEIEGAIPPRIYEMTTLRTLFLDENKITGTISTDIGNLVNLEKFTLNRNEIVGEIPTEIGLLDELSM